MSLKSFLFLFSVSFLISSSLLADRYKTYPRPRECAKAIAGSYGEIEDTAMLDVWSRYKALNSGPEKTNIRNFLIEKYQHLVKAIAAKIHARLPDEVDIEDLVAVGIFGLIDAINGFDLNRGIKFETYSAPRIRGAILDHLREMDWVPRLVRSRSAEVKQAQDEFRKRNGHLPSEYELAELLIGGMNGQVEPESNAEKIIRDGSTITAKSSLYQTRRKTKNGYKELSEIDTIADQTAESPAAILQRKHLFESITKSLSRAERLLISLRYYEGMSMNDIGKVLDVSESRVSQMHASILLRLEAQLTASTISQLEEASH